MSPVKPNSAPALIAARMREVRAAMNVTQEDFADIIGVSRNHVSDIETGRVEPSIVAIVGVLCIDLRVQGTRVPMVNAEWLLLGPRFCPEMFGSRPKGFFKRTTPAERQDMADEAGAGHSL